MSTLLVTSWVPEDAPQNYHIIKEQSFEKMKKTAYFLNTAREPIVDEEALIQALKSHLIL